MSAYEMIDSAELAKRWGVRQPWIQNQTGPSRTSDPIPHVRLGKQPRYRWGSPELEGWLERRCVGCSKNVHGAGSSERRAQ